MRRCNSRRFIRAPLRASRRFVGQQRRPDVKEAIRFERFCVDFLEGRNIVIPFEQRRCWPAAVQWRAHRVSTPDQGPDGRAYRGYISRTWSDRRYESGQRVPKEYCIHVVHRIEAVVLRGDIDVIDIEQNAAVGSMNNLVEELPFGHLRIRETRHSCLRFRRRPGSPGSPAPGGYALRRDTHGFKRIWERQKIVGIAAIDTSPAEMIGEPGSFGAFCKLLRFASGDRGSSGCAASEVHRNTVLNDSVLIENLVENL